MRLGDAMGEVEPQAKTPGVCPLSEALEDVWQEARIDTGPLVADSDVDPGAMATRVAGAQLVLLQTNGQ